MTSLVSGVSESQLARIASLEERSGVETIIEDEAAKEEDEEELAARLSEMERREKLLAEKEAEIGRREQELKDERKKWEEEKE